MKAVVLAGGLGTRLQPIIGNNNQKVMHKYGNKPLLERTIEILRDKRFEDIVIVVNYKKERIINYFGDGKNFGVNIEYVEQINPKGGTADATKYAKEKIQDRKFLLVYGDNIFEPKTIDELLEKNNNYDGILCCKEVEDPRKFGVLEVEGDKVTKIIEKSEHPPTNLALIGLFVLPPEIFWAIEETELSPRGELELTDSIQILINKGMKFGFIKVKGFWSDPRDKEEMMGAEEFIKKS